MKTFLYSMILLEMALLASCASIQPGKSLLTEMAARHMAAKCHATLIVFSRDRENGLPFASFATKIDEPADLGSPFRSCLEAAVKQYSYSFIGTRNDGGQLLK